MVNNNCVINKNCSISDAFLKIDKNHARAIIVVDDENKVIGVATDGDIRRYLISNPDVSSKIGLCSNKDYTFANENDDREKILKLLDNTILIVPIVNNDGVLVDVITRNDFPIQREKQLVARAKSPVRISFGGGGTDLTHYFVKHKGAVMNSTIKIYSHASLKKRSDSKVIIQSKDIGETIEANSLEELKREGPFSLIVAAINLIDPSFGFELVVYSDFPMKSGLGGSAVVISSIIGCFNEFREDRWDSYEMAELAFQAERITLDLAGGWQDQYATIFGGFNFMEFSNDHNIVHPLRISRRTRLELEENLILCYTNLSHESGDIHKEQKKHFDGNNSVQDLVHKNQELTYKMKNLLLKNRLDSFGACLGEGWNLKRQFSPASSNKYLDSIYELAISNGAIAGKLLGAGGGGFFLFYVKPFDRMNLISALEDKGCTISNVLFDSEGLQTWKVRIN
jgi:D-glycero-alpha-D-manno-heptose-7-phosphate kinase